MRLHAQRSVYIVIASLLAVGSATLLDTGCGNSGGGGGSTAPVDPTSVAIGTPATVHYATTVGNAESGAKSLAFTVAAAGNYQCNAHAAEGAVAHDAQLAIFNGPTEVGRDSDSGPDTDAQLSVPLQPGAYTVKVWEWTGHSSAITVTCIAGPAAPPNPTSVALGAPAVVNVVAGEGAGSQVDLALGIAAAGHVECRAHAAAADGSGLDAYLTLLQGANTVGADDDTGGNRDALLAIDLQPGAYTVRVKELFHRDGAITVTCTAGAAGAPVGGALALGAPSTVNVPAGEGPAGQAELTLTIEGEGNYQCRSHAAAADGSGLDGQISILQNGTEIASDSDSGGNMDALVTRDFTAGTYTVRVWEWLHRAAAITVTCGLTPPPG